MFINTTHRLLLQDWFTATPNYKSYTLPFPSKEVFDPQIAMKRYNRTIDWRKVLKGPEMDDKE
jgi:hypothetical protein